jgi:hypothetical protein
MAMTEMAARMVDLLAQAYDVWWEIIRGLHDVRREQRLNRSLEAARLLTVHISRYWTLLARADAARVRLDARRAKINKSRGRSLWPWAVPLALCIMVAGNTLLAISDFIPGNLHAKGTSFALTMTAYFITCLAFIRSGRHRGTPSS